MKKRFVHILLLSFCMMIGVGCSAYIDRSLGSMEGIFLKSSSGAPLIISEHGAITMSNETGEEGLFEDLHSGDKIEIKHDEIAESYPAQTTIYSCELKEKGSKEDVPKDTLDQLEEMGWTFEFAD